MRPSLFKITAVFALLISMVTAQTKTVYQKTFPTNSNTKLNLDLNNASVVIESSPNNEVQIDFRLEFENYTEKGIKKVLDGIEVNSRTRNNLVDFRVVSKTKIARESFLLSANEGLILDENKIKAKNEKKNPYRTREEVLNEIKNPNGLKKNFLENVKILKDDGTKTKFNRKDVQRMKSLFTIKIPKDLYFRLQGTETQVFVMFDLTQKAEIHMSKGMFRAKKLEHKESRVSSKGSNIYIESISADQLMLDDVSKGIFGSIAHTDCTFKGSRVELGFIGPEVSIRDYNSKIYFYNFDKNFAALPFNGEYTELFVYDYEKNVKLKAKGSITLMFDDENPFGSGSKGVKPTTAVVETTVKKKPYGKIEVNLENGVLHIMDNKEKK
jgi:uncharacterized protein YdeI (YjbR/CyaY-like superfamily)